MNTVEAVILGTLQGLTEFLPVSSSGHLVIGEYLFGIQSETLTFEVFVHFGTLLSVVIIFRKKILALISSFLRGALAIITLKSKMTTVYGKDSDFRYSSLIVCGTIPAGVIGILFEEVIENMFNNIYHVAVMLLITGGILYATRFFKSDNTPLSLRNVLFIGCAQACAIIPGISRSGMTIGAGLFCKIDKAAAAEFSFLLSLPVIGGATLLKLKDLIYYETGSLLQVSLGTLAAFISGYFSLLLLLSVIKKGRLYLFSYYCWTAGASVLVSLSVL